MVPRKGQTLLDSAECTVAWGHRRYRGVALVWSAIMMMLMILLIGLSIDTAKVALISHQLHNAADAAALAGGPWVRRDQLRARQLARDMAALNFADKDASGVPQPVLLDLNEDNDPNGDIIVGRYTYDRVTGMSYFTPFDPTSPNPIPVNALAVLASRDTVSRTGHQASQEVSLNFGPIAGVQSLPVTGRWQTKRGPYAIVMTGGGVGAGLICLRRDRTGLHVHGTCTLTVNNLTDSFDDGGIQINSFDPNECVTTAGHPRIIADIMNICADGFTQKGEFEFPPEPEMYVNLRQPPLPDPLAWLNKPGVKPTDPALGLIATDLGGIAKNETPPDPVPSGYYSGGFSFDSGTAANPIHLSAGIYILGGNGLTVGAHAYVVADPGVFFYITGEGACDIQAGTHFEATPMTDGPYENIIIAQDPLDLKCASITGGPGFLLEGTMYFPQHVVLDPKEVQKKTDYALQLDGGGDAFNNQIIADSVYIPGNSDVTINYDGRNPAPITRAYLVE